MSSTSAVNSLLSSASTSSSSSIDLSSLLTAATGATSSGIDVTSAVDAAIYAAQAPERQWQTEQATLQSQITALSSVQTATASLSTDLQNLADPLGALAARTVSSSNAQIVTATATPGTATGSHTVSVSQLATAASWYSPPVSSSSASLGSSALTITAANGTATTFALGNSSLSALVQSINAAKLGVQASVVQDASGSRLVLAGSTTGSQGGFTVSDSGGSSAAWRSAEVASSSVALPASTFQLSDGTSSASIQVQSGDTLADVANQVNASGLNLSAQVVTDSTGSYLSITTSNGAQVTAGSDPVLQMTQASSAQNASLVVDGVPVSSSSNTVTGALSGVTLTLNGTTGTGSPTTLGVSADASQINSAISQFVTDYNSAISSVSAQFTFSASSASQGVLGSDSVVRSLQSALLGAIGYSQSSAGASQSLADLGISMQDDGTLKLDSATLSQKIASNPQSVQTFFQGTAGKGFASVVGAQIQAFSQATTGGLASDISNLTQRYNDLQSDISNFETSYVAPQKTLLTAMYSKAEIALQSLPSTLKQIQAELNNNNGS